jgi:hypothetical protein
LPSSIEKLHREFKDQGLTVWAVNMNEPKALVAAWVKEKRLTFPVLLDDGTVTRAYRVRATPTVIFVDRAGRLWGRTVGAREWYPEGRELLAALLAQR